MDPAALALLFKVTAYGLGCDAPNQVTASGYRPVEGFTVAADTALLPFGTIVEIEGVGVRIVEDRGGGVRGRHLDVFFGSCSAAWAWGVQERLVRILHLPERGVLLAKSENRDVYCKRCRRAFKVVKGYAESAELCFMCLAGVNVKPPKAREPDLDRVGVECGACHDVVYADNRAALDKAFEAHECQSAEGGE